MPTEEQAAAYLCADDDDTMRPDWEDILAICEKPVAEAYIAAGLWKDSYTYEDPEPAGLMPPSLRDVIDNALCTDFLVFASDSERKELLEWLRNNGKLVS